MGILSGHEGSCSKKPRLSPSDCQDEQQQQQESFRIPLPPQNNHQSLSTTTPATGFNDVSSSGFETDQYQLPAEIKPELESPTDPNAGWASASCAFDQQLNENEQQGSNHFLAKRSLGCTYLDLDSRCIAL